MFGSNNNQEKTYLYHLSYLLIACFLFVQCSDDSSSPEPETHAVQGAVVNTTDNPVFEAEVQIMDGEDEVSTATTDTEGAFQLTGIPAGSYELVVSKDGYNDYTTDLNVDEEVVEEVELLGDADVSGKVIDWQTEAGLENAEIAFSFGATVSEADTSRPNFTTSTDSEGNFSIEDAPSGNFVCVIYRDGYVPEVIEELNFDEGSNDLGESVITEAFDYAGTVSNSTDNTVFEATVELIVDGEVYTSATTDEEGIFKFNGIPGGDHELRIDRDGYEETTSSVSIYEDVEDAASVEFELLGNATITGRVLGSQTSSGVSDANVEFSFGGTLSEADTSRPEITTITDSEGYYTIEQAPSGEFVCVIYADSYEPQIVEDIEVSEGENDLGESTTVEEVEEGNIRIVLTWGEDPSDLDTHFTGPMSDNSEDRFHLLWSDQNPASHVNLDVDDVTSYGPETTTLTEQYEGNYRYSVFNYSNQDSSGGAGIEQSPAHVEVYDSSGLIAEYDPPEAEENSGNTWRVFKMDITDGEVNLEEWGIYEHVEDDHDDSQFRIDPNGKTGSYDISDF